MKKCTKLTILMTCVIVSMAEGSSTVSKQAIMPSGTSSVSLKLSNAKVEALFQTVRLEKGSSAFPLLDWEPNAVILIQKLEISVGEKKVFVPRSVFADLLDPRTATIQAKNGDFVLTISGGDASEAYFVHVYFDTTRVKRKMVYSSLTPSRVAEDTHYQLNVLKDE